MAEVNDRLAVELSANVSKLLDGLKKAGDATAVWGDASGRQVEKVSAAFNGVQFEGATSKLKAETLKMIELTHQLDVARIAGDKQTAAALQEQITLMQRIRQLRSAGFDAPTAMKAAGAQGVALAAAAAAAATRRKEEEAAEQAAQRRERITGNPGAALQSIASRTRVGVLEEGSSKIPLYGSALEELGVAGLAAAAGLAAVGIAAEQVRKAMEFAEEIEKTSQTLGVSTTQLQAFDDAAIATSIGQDKARESLQQFNEVFGKYSSGLATGRTAKFLDALGFTPESARQIGDVGGALEKTLVSLSKLQNPQQRASLATQLGLANFLPVLAEGTEGVETFLAKMREAQTNGSIISPEQIRQAAEMNDKVEELSHRISVEFKSAFIDAAPAIEKVAEFIESCTKKLSEFIGEIPNAIAGLQLFRNQAGGKAGDAASGFGSVLGSAVNGIAPGFTDVLGATAKGGKAAFDALADRGKRIRLSNGIDDLLAGKVTDPEGRREYEGASRQVGVDLSPPKKPKKGPADPTPELFNQGLQDVDSDQKALDEARAALTANIQAHADAELKAIADENAKRQDDLDAQIDKINATKGLTAETTAALIAQRTQASDLAAAAAVAKSAKVSRDAENAQDSADLSDANELQGYRDAVLTAQASLAKSAQARAAIALQVLKDEQYAALEQKRLSEQRAVASGSKTQPEADAAVAGLQASQNAQLVTARTQQQRQINPLYARANPTTSVQDDLQGIEAKGLDSVTDDLASLATNAKSAKAEFHDLINSMITDLIKLGLQRSLEAPLANALFGASPTNNLGALGQTASAPVPGASIFSLAGGLFSGLVGSNSSGVPGAHDVDTSAFSAIDALKLPSFLPQLIPGFATGTDDTPGGLTRYDEQGTEGYVPPGAQIIPNETLKGLAALTPEKLGGGATTIVQGPQFHLESPVLTQDLLDQMTSISQAHYAAAVATSRNDQKLAKRSARQDMTRF